MTTLLDLIEQKPLSDFDRWRMEHEAAVRYIAALALTQAARGATRLSAKALFESARAAGYFGSTVNGQPARLNNNWTADAARWLMETYPKQLGGKFATRKRRDEA